MTHLDLEKKAMPATAKKFMNNRSIWILSCCALCSSLIFVIFWWTNVFQDAIINNLQIRNGTLNFVWWQRPVVRAIYKVRIFNYTNIEDFEAGRAAKLRVQEVGPYVYRETLTRVNPEIHDNGTISYQEMRSYQWEGGSPDDEMVTVPNVPLFSAIAYSRDLNVVAQLALSTFLTTLREKTFVTVQAGGFLWGYDDHFYRMVKPILSLQQNGQVLDKFGILAMKTGLSKDRIMIHSGTEDINKLGVIARLNGKERRDVWDDEACDKIDGTDGTMFPPTLLRDQNNVLKVYAVDMCRSVPLKYHSVNMTKGIPTLRYKPPVDSFTSTHTNWNSCFCQKSDDKKSVKFTRCPPAGIFNASSCNFGTPILSSAPHFFLGDKILQDQIEGLNPQEELHQTYVDLHPLLGIPIGGWSRLQVNLEARKANAVPFMGKVQDGTILPLVWVEMGLDEFPDNVMSLLHHAHYTVNLIQSCFQWGSLIGVLLSVSALAFILRRRARMEKHAVLQRNSSGQNPLLE